MNVQEVMTHTVHTCSPHESLNRAAQIMWEGDCGCAPIVDSDGKPIGMITDRDICMAAYTQGLPIDQIPVARFATEPIISIDERSTVETASRLMRDHQIRRLPVVDAAGRLTGIVSMTDLARKARATPDNRNGFTAEGVAQTLAAVCSPKRNHSHDSFRS